MGDYGSSRWPWSYRRKTTVEQCAQLRLSALKVRTGMGVAATTCWGQNNIGLVVATGAEQGTVTLQYDVVHGVRREPIREDIALVTTALHRGGLHWWFLCPGCGGRCAVLYLSPGGRWFRCRRCHRLVYRSSQRHDKTRDRYRRMWRRDPEALLQLVEAGDVGACLTMLEERYGR